MFWSSIPISSLVVSEILVLELSTFWYWKWFSFFPSRKISSWAVWWVFRASQGQTLEMHSLHSALGLNCSVVFGAEADVADPALKAIPVPLVHRCLEQRLWQFTLQLSFVSFLLKFPWNLSFCLQGHSPTQRGWYRCQSFVKWKVQQKAIFKSYFDVFFSPHWMPNTDRRWHKVLDRIGNTYFLWLLVLITVIFFYESRAYHWPTEVKLAALRVALHAHEEQGWMPSKL